MSVRRERGGVSVARAKLRRLVATASITSGAAGTVAGASYRVIGAHLVAAAATDDGVIDDALELAHTARLDLAAAPAGCIDDVAAKLGHLVKGLLSDADGALQHETEMLALAAGALADLALLRAGPFECPASPAAAARPRTPAERAGAQRAAERRAGL